MAEGASFDHLRRYLLNAEAEIEEVAAAAIARIRSIGTTGIAKSADDPLSSCRVAQELRADGSRFQE